MRQMPAASVDFVLTDPPYLVRYRSRDGRVIQNDVDDRWLKPAFAEAFRVLRWHRFACASTAGLKPTNSSPPGKPPASGPWNISYSANLTRPTCFLRYQHEQAYLQTKGEPALPDHPIADVLDMRYNGNHLHQTQKVVSALLPLIETLSAEGDLVLDRSAAPAQR